jgi:site-specific DNA recombinase
MIRVALYARVSSEQQEQRGTVASQVAAVRAYARAHQFAVCEDYVCVDDGYSGARLDRPGLDRLRDGAALRAFDAVVVRCPDRLARRYAYQVLLVEELSRWDIPVHFCENPPPPDPQAQLLVQLQGIMADYA